MVTLNEHTFLDSQEMVYSTTLQNGLTVYLIPKNEFKEAFALLSVQYGSMDTQFISNNHLKQDTEGLAHFLEHKLFEMTEGKDVTTQFTDLGAEVNAFTTFDKTCFYFSTVDKVNENLDVLRHFILEASMTEVSVLKEKDIIRQEIAMYQDDADYRLYQGVLENLYPNTALATDIAGSNASLEKMTLADLQESHQTFYKLDNMTLVLVGHFYKDAVLASLTEKDEEKTPADKSVIEKEALAYHPVVPRSNIQMDITQPKIAIGFRGQPLESHQSVLRQELALKLFFGMVIGWTSHYYQDLYKKGYIDDSFDFEMEIHSAFQFVMVSLDTLEPIAMLNQIRKHLDKVSHDSAALADLSEEHFTIVKRELYGTFFRELDSIEQLGMQFVNYLGKGDYFTIPTLLESLTFTEVVETGMHFLKTADVTEFTILPK